MVNRTNSSTGARHQESSVRRSLVTPRVAASVSTVENIGGAATPFGVPTDEDRASALGSDREVVFHINGKEVTKEEWAQLHKKWEDQEKQR